jgi:hypothetical protein
MIQMADEQQPRRYNSYEEYLQHFYGATTLNEYTILNLEASFGKKLAKRVLEVEANEKTQSHAYPPS